MMTLTHTHTTTSATTNRRAVDLRVEEVVDSIHRVEYDGVTLGYVLVTGERFVSLRGAVYNTSLEIGQSLDLETAVHCLLDR